MSVMKCNSVKNELPWREVAPLETPGDTDDKTVMGLSLFISWVTSLRMYLVRHNLGMGKQTPPKFLGVGGLNTKETITNVTDSRTCPVHGPRSPLHPQLQALCPRVVRVTGEQPLLRMRHVSSGLTLGSWSPTQVTLVASREPGSKPKSVWLILTLCLHCTLLGSC